METKNSDWTLQQHTDMLPNRFVAVGYTIEGDGDDSDIEQIDFVKLSAEVPESIATGLIIPEGTQDNSDFSFEPDDSTSNPAINAHDSLRWMTDFQAALDNGVAFEIDLPVASYSKIVVFGVKDKTLEQSETLLEELFEDHQYSKGLSLLTPCTTTNNTKEESSEFSSFDREIDESFKVHASGNLFSESNWASNKPDQISDGQKFATALGIDSKLFYNVKNAGSHSSANAHKMKQVLFSGTLGAHIDEMWSNLLTPEDRKKVQYFFEDYVFGQGVLPNFMVGNQPYGLIIGSKIHHSGVLPTEENYFTDHNGFRFKGETAQLSNSLDFSTVYNAAVNEISDDFVVDPAVDSIDWDIRFNVRIKEFLKHLDIKWRDLAQSSLKNVYEDNVSHFQSENSATPQKQFLELFRQSPYSIEYFSRHALNTGLIESVESLQNAPFWPNQVGSDDLSKIQPSGHQIVERILFGNDINASHFPKGLFYLPTYPHLKHLNPNMVHDHSNGLDDFKNYIKSTSAFLNKPLSRAIKLEGGLLQKTGAVPYSTFLTNLSNTHPLDLMMQCIPEINGYQNESNSLLYLLMRNSLLLKYRKTSMEILVNEGLSGWQSLEFLGTPEASTLQDLSNNNWYKYFSSGKKVLSKWNVLFSTYGENSLYYLGGSLLNPLSFPHHFSGDQGLPTTQDNIYDDILDSFDQNEFITELMTIPGAHNKFDLYHTNELDQAHYELTNDPLHADRRYSMADFLFPGDYSNEVTKAHLDWVKSSSSYYYNKAGGNLSLLNQIEKFHDCIAEFANLSEKELDYLLGQTLDISSHRLDSWISGLYAKKLDQIRNIRKPSGSTFSTRNLPSIFDHGSYIGAFGYVESLTKDSGLVTSEPTNGAVTTEEISELENEYNIILNADISQKDTTKDGFIFTPSVDHAVTAAVLRSGYLSSKLHESSNLTNQMAVSLSSKRVRMALELLNGVRNGQDLNHLLGYRLEEEMYKLTRTDSELGKLVISLRKSFPNDIVDTTLDVPVSNRNYEFAKVCDGLAILEATSTIVENTLQPGEPSILAHFDEKIIDDVDINAENFNQLLTELKIDTEDFSGAGLGIDSRSNFLTCLEILNGTFDAFADLAISEGVFQIVKGNTERANAYMTMLGGSRTLIEPEIVKTRKSGISFKQNVMLNMTHASTITADNNWTNISSQYAQLEPSLNKWLQEIIGDPDKIIIHAEYKLTGSDTAVIIPPVKVSDLNIQAIDFMRILEIDPFKGNFELDSRITQFIRNNVPEAKEAQIAINYEDMNVAAGQRSLYELYPQLNAINQLLLESNIGGANDFTHENDIGDTSYPGNYDDWNTLKIRLTQIKENLRVFLENTPSITTKITNATLDDIYGFAKELADYNAPGILFTKPITAENLDDIKEQAKSAILILQDRLAQATSILNENPTSEEDLLSLAERFAKLLVGNTAKILPKFSLHIPETPFVQGENYSTSSEGWIQGLSLVRKKIKHLDELITFDFMNRLTNGIELSMYQFPQASDDNSDVWLGGKWTDADQDRIVKQGSKLSVAMTHPELLNTPEVGFVSLRIDDWTEIIPTKEETAAIAFNYDMPNSEAPQAVILAIPPREVTDDE